jgi:hypothetical protein
MLQTYLNLLLGEGDTLHDFETRLLIRFRVLPVRLLEDLFIVGSAK